MISSVGMTATSGGLLVLSRASNRCQNAPALKTQIKSNAPVSLGLRSHTISSRVPKRRLAVNVAANSDGLKWELAGQGLDSKNDYSAAIAVAGFAATHFSKFSVSATQFLQAVAILQLVTAVVGVVTRKLEFDHVAVVVGPSVLAVYVLALQHVSYLQAATALFGYYLSEHLEGPTTVPFWVWAATLAAALYAGYGSQWYVAAWGLLSLIRLVRGFQDNAVPLLSLPILVASVYALAKEHTVTLTLLLFLGQVVWSGVRVLDAFTTRVK